MNEEAENGNEIKDEEEEGERKAAADEDNSDEIDEDDENEERMDEKEDIQDDEDFDSTSEKEKKLKQRILICELLEDGQCIRVAHGGLGGRGNAQLGRDKLLTNPKSSFPLASTKAEPGKPGTSAILSLELKLIADVALVGFPNAGKSTLLNELTNARPRIGHYAFTTTQPQLGRIEFDDFFGFTVADIPGLIEGAHLNRGLGIQFLRHIERTKIFCFVIDLAPPRGGFSPSVQLGKLFLELEQYDSKMRSRPFFVIANKMDEMEAAAGLEELKKELPEGVQIIPTCAVLGEGIEEVRSMMRQFVENHIHSLKIPIH